MQILEVNSTKTTIHIRQLSTGLPTHLPFIPEQHRWGGAQDGRQRHLRPDYLAHLRISCCGLGPPLGLLCIQESKIRWNLCFQALCVMYKRQLCFSRGIERMCAFIYNRYCNMHWFGSNCDVCLFFMVEGDPWGEILVLHLWEQFIYLFIVVVVYIFDHF